MNEQGFGGAADPVEAYKWFVLATRYIPDADGPFRKTTEARLPMTRNVLSPHQLAAANKLVEAWAPKRGVQP